MSLLNVKLVAVMVLSLMTAYNAIELPEGCLSAFRNTALLTHNILRSKHKSVSLVENANLDASALNWANYMAENNVFHHSKNLVNTGENIHASYLEEPLTTEHCARDINSFLDINVSINSFC